MTFIGKIILLVLFNILILLAPTFSQLMGYHISDGKNRTSFGIEIYNNLIVVPVMLDGRLPLKFILDSGVNSAILFEREMTDFLGKEYSRLIQIQGVGEQKSIQAYVVNSIEIGLPGMTGYNQSLLVLEEDYLRLAEQMGVEVHGILGYELFRKFVVDVDYLNERISFYDYDKFLGKKKYHQMDLSVSSTKPYIDFPIWVDEDSAKVNGNFMVDTGASHAILLHEQSDEHIYIPEKRLPSLLGKGLMGNINGYLSRIDKMKFGDIEFEDVIVSFPDEHSYADSLVVAHRNGTIGGELLSRFRIVFNYLDGRFYVKKTRHTDDPFEYNMSGIDVAAEGPDLDSIKVTSVRENSPGDSVGIKKGDYILSANGMFGDFLSLSSLYKLFNSKPGRKIRMTIWRQDEKIKKKFYLRKDI